MTIHHLNCGSLCPAIVDNMVCHCLLVESSDGLILVDSGLGTRDISRTASPLPRSWKAMVRPQLRLEETAIEQVKALGYSPKDVRHIVVTHLDLDHAGGISDFPWATVHAHEREIRGAEERATKAAKQRYLTEHFAHGPTWQKYSEAGENWFGFVGVRAVINSDAEVVLVPLHGHTEGHTGVAVRDGERWLFHCGDAFFHRATIEGGRIPWLISFFEGRAEADRQERLSNSKRLRDLALSHSDEVTLFNSHDGVLYNRIASASP